MPMVIDSPSAGAMPSWAYRVTFPSLANGSDAPSAPIYPLSTAPDRTIILSDLVPCRLILIEVVLSVETAGLLYIALQCSGST